MLSPRHVIRRSRHTGLLGNLEHEQAAILYKHLHDRKRLIIVTHLKHVRSTKVQSE
jgi:hypothetical protein